MKVLITGATGFIGRRLVDALVDGGHEVTVWTRDTDAARAALPVRCDVEFWNGRAVSPDAVCGFDGVVNLAGAGVADARWTDARKREIHESRERSTRALASALASAPQAERPSVFVSASAIGIYGDRGDDVLDERAAPGDGFLADVCRSWESEAMAVRAVGVRAVCVRVGIVLGRDGGALATMLPPFRLGLGGRLGSGAQWMSWIHIDDVVRLFVLALTDGNVAGAVGAVAPDAVTNREFTASLGRALGRPALFPVPAIGLRVALGEMASMLLASQRVAPSVALAHGFEFLHPKLEGALADLSSDLDHELETEQWFPRPPDEVFAFFSDARNLERITPEFLGFKIANVSTDKVEQGTVIDYRLSLHGAPLRWQSVIEDWQPGRKFVDRQRRGPYARWHHTHEFEPHDGGTLVRDRVRYALPLAPLGDLVAGRMVDRDLGSIFDYRRRTLDRLLG